MRFSQPRNCLYFDQHYTGHDEIESLPRNEPLLVANQNSLLALKRETSAVQFEAIRALVDDFSEARPEIAMDRNSSADTRPQDLSCSSGIGT